MVEPARLTRRAVLAGAAGLGAASAFLPARSLAAGGLPRAVSIIDIGRVAGETRLIAAPGPFALAGVGWQGPAHPRIELRARASDGSWSRWAVASLTGHGPDRTAPAPIGEPVWFGEADAIQVRTDRPLTDVRIFLISVPAAGARAAAARSLPLAQPVLETGPGQPPIIARAAWARRARPAAGPFYGVVRLAFVHHTENPNGYSAGEVPGLLYGIYLFHRYVRGWNDIGYNFIIDAFGQIWEARAGGIDQAVIGAQAGGYNGVSTGVAVLGSFTSTEPSAAAQDALTRLLAWKLSLHGVPTQGRVTVVVPGYDAFYTPFRGGQHVSLPRIAGHRDGDSTSCPGDAFYHRLPALRPRAAALAGSPRHLDFSVTPTGGAAPVTPTFTGRLTALDGPPVAGATVELQSLTGEIEAPIATVTTAADGTFSGTLAPVDHSLLVRALSPAAPAVASDLVLVAVAPVLSVTVTPGHPVMVSGSVSPPTRTVTVEILALRRGRRRVVATRHVRLRGGTFTTRLRLRRGHRLWLRVVTPDTAANAAAESQLLPVSG